MEGTWLCPLSIVLTRRASHCGLSAFLYPIEKYLHPKYPNIGLDSRFGLPDRIDTARVGTHKLTVTQK